MRPDPAPRWMRQNKADLIGLTGFGPNINIARDPRFGYVQQLFCRLDIL